MRARGVKRTGPATLAARTHVSQHAAVSSRLAAHRAGAVVLPTSYQIKGIALLEQGRTPTCFAHAPAYATAIAWPALGFVPSPKLTAAGATALDRGAGGTPAKLDDEGGTIESVNAFLSQFGAEPMGSAVDGRNSDVSLGNMNDEINLADLNAASQRVLTGQYGVDPSEGDISDTLAACLASDLPIVTTFYADSAFENLQAGQVAGAPDTSDANGGPHAVVLSGYSQQGGERVFLLDNWWNIASEGEVWCDGGTCLVGVPWVSAAYELWPWAVAKVSA